MDFLVSLVLTALLFGVFIMIGVGSWRYARRQQRRGRWDKYGPLVETESPRWAWRSLIGWGGSMNERLEVIGQWHGRVLRRRKPNEDPSVSTADPQDHE